MFDSLKSIIKTIIARVIEREARLVLARFKPRIIAVTGSVGKTSTKDAVFNVLRPSFSARKSEKSYNSEFGLPLTILGQPSAWMSPLGWAKIIFMGATEIFFPAKYPEWLVLEIGADRPGDIRRMMKWLKPDIGVLTRLPDIPVHIEFFGDRDGVVREKLALAQGVKKDGLIIYNRDDDTLHERVKDLSQKKITYGFAAEADVKASNVQIIYDENEGQKLPTGLSFKIDYNGQIIPIRIKGVVGRHQIYATLAALSVAVAENLNIVAVAETIQSSHEGPPGRLKLISGVKGSLILDDTYNSSPVALEAAILTLGEIETSGQKIAVLGDMLELGEHTIEAHRQAGKLVAAHCDRLITVGLRSKFIEEGAKEGGMKEEQIEHFDTSTEAGVALEKLLALGAIALIKGSQGMRMERAVLEVMREPLRAEELLCRQELEWLKR